MDDDDLINIDTSEFNFPNVLWHVKPAKEIAFKTTAMLLVGITGIFLNSVIIIIILRNRWLWCATNYLILNMAFIDMTTLLFSPWFMLIKDFYQNYVLKNFGCRFEGFMQASLLLAGVGAIVLVTYDRLAAAALPMDARITKAHVPKLIAITWILSMALSLPWILKREYVERQWKNYLESYCKEDVLVLGIYWHLTLSLLVWIPLGLMLVTYGAIMWKLEWSTRRLIARGGGIAVTKAKRRAVRITACVLITDIICRLPYTVLIYWRNRMTMEINSVEGSFDAMWFVAHFCLYLNCAINPLIYGFTNYRFRKAMDRTPGVAMCKFGSWCCTCSKFRRRSELTAEKTSEKIFVVETSPKPDKKMSHIIKNILHINKDAIDFSTKNDEVTKPTKITPMKTEQ